MVQFALTDIYLAWMAFSRLTAMFFLIPILSSRNVPMQARIALSALTAIMLVPMLDWQGALPHKNFGLAIATLGEILVGLLMGVAARLMFFAVDFAMDIIAQQAALVRSSTFDPTTMTKSTALGPLYTYLATIVFCATGTHLEILGAVVRSYDFVPAGMGLFSFGGMEYITRATSDVFVLGLKMAAPLIALSFVVNVVFAVLGKVSPKVNVLIISFGARILLSFLLLVLTVKLMLQFILAGLNGTAIRMLEFIVT